MAATVVESPADDKEEDDKSVAEESDQTKVRGRGAGFRVERNKFKYRIDARDARVVGDVLRDRGWLQVEGESTAWDLFWCDLAQMKETTDKRLGRNQRVPHFRNFYELTRKNHLARNLQRYKKALLKEDKIEEAELCDCVPLSFELPSEYHMFFEYFRKNANLTWIVKPAIGSQGRGIFLFRRLKDLNEWRASKDWSGKEVTGPDGVVEIQPEIWVVQRYVETPYLIAGKKFDLRIYVLVMSFNPLKVWISREGFGRLCGADFNMARIKDTFAHLTNTHIQLSSAVENQGHKWPMARLREYLTARHGHEVVINLIQDIAKVVVISLQSVQKCMVNSVNCFELYGYDVLLDEELRPHLLEVNSSPSLVPTDKADYWMKYYLLLDTINVLDLEGDLTGREVRVGGFDLVWDDGPVHAHCPGGSDLGPALYQDELKLNCFLGGLNDRTDHLQALKMWKSHFLNQMNSEEVEEEE